MFEWLSEQYLNLVVNYSLLMENSVGCSTVVLLRIFTLMLLTILLINLTVHILIIFRLKRKFSEYSSEGYPRLYQLYRKAARKANVHRLPPLYEFNNEKPLIFTIGTLRPVVFLAPSLAEKIQPEELKAALVHELTHIKRHDNLLIWLLQLFFASIPVLIVQIFALNLIFSIENSICAVVGALTFVTLFKAFLWKRILYLREISCDDLTVDVIKNPLTLASSLVNIWRIESQFPKHSWFSGLAFAQNLLPIASNFQSRVQRLINYRRPRLKFFLGKAARVVSLFLTVLSMLFLWRFYSIHNHEHFACIRINGSASIGSFCISSETLESLSVLCKELSKERLNTVISNNAEILIKGE